MKELVGESWDRVLSSYLDKEYFHKLGVYIQNQRKRGKVFPLQEDIFNAFKYTSYDNVRIVIIGLDPYIKEGEAYGVSFGIRDTCWNIPPSLRNIRKEIEADVYNGLQLDFDYTLQKWCNQGCFMYNTALTVRSGATGSHIKMWSKFTEAVLQALNDKDNVIYLLLGKVAQSYGDKITNPTAYKVLAPHPAAEGYSGGKAGFFNSGVFTTINQILASNNEEIIKW